MQARRGTVSTFLSPCAGGLTRVSVLDCRDETADHLGRLGTAVQVQGCREVSAAVP
jgi:hypothetical protein